jgi:signal transduction histidine kinase
LGLPITKAIVENHGGTIRVDSVLGQGSRFSACFPDADAEVAVAEA